ncbi:probable carbohydrate esterase At4g34215 [Euphorbia lathyris]|uniref:probable carbohydrate esterase At4g34215 n=1 Tax=Euphorbia lathyris TaxID=212925 RepID=UPI0033131F95
MLFFFLFLLLGEAIDLVKSQQLPTDIFILAGQSNMAGRGGVVINPYTGNLTWDGIVPPESQPNPSILRLSAQLNWVLAQEPLHADIDYNKINGVGPGMAFANAILKKEPRIGAVGLVPCAIGGTNISQWGKGGFLYEELVRRTKEALKSGGVVRAMLWYQGESDTKDGEETEFYEERLTNFFTEIRADLNHPLLRIIHVGLASGEGPFIEEIREAQLGIKLQNVANVDARGLQLEADRLHLTTAAQVHLGQLLADALLHFPSIFIPNPIQTTNVFCLSNTSSYHYFLFLISIYLLSLLLFFFKKVF